MIGRFFNNNKISIFSIEILEVCLGVIIPGALFGFFVFHEAGLFAPILGVIPLIATFLIFRWYNGYKIRERKGLFYATDGLIQVKENQLEYNGKTIDFDTIKYASGSSTMYRIQYINDEEKNGNVIFTFKNPNEMNMFKADFVSKYRSCIHPRENPFVY